MAVEIEAKMKLEPAAVAEVASRLRASGATLLGSVLEQNIFLDRNDGSLKKADQGLRIRTSTDLSSGAARTVVTHKGPTQSGPLKMREETEVDVASAADMLAVFERLGFVRLRSFQKRRQSWKLEDCKIELDEVPHLGHFIEIEGPTEESVMRLRQRLGLASLPLIKVSYIAMLTAYLEGRRESAMNIVFPSEPKRSDV